MGIMFNHSVTVTDKDGNLISEQVFTDYEQARHYWETVELPTQGEATITPIPTGEKLTVDRYPIGAYHF